MGRCGYLLIVGINGKFGRLCSIVYVIIVIVIVIIIGIGSVKLLWWWCSRI